MTYSKQEVKTLIQAAVREPTPILLQELNEQKLWRTNTSDEIISQILTATVTAAAATLTENTSNETEQAEGHATHATQTTHAAQATYATCATSKENTRETHRHPRKQATPQSSQTMAHKKKDRDLLPVPTHLNKNYYLKDTRKAAARTKKQKKRTRNVFQRKTDAPLPTHSHPYFSASGAFQPICFIVQIFSLLIYSFKSDLCKHEYL